MSTLQSSLLLFIIMGVMSCNTQGKTKVAVLKDVSITENTALLLRDYVNDVTILFYNKEVLSILQEGNLSVYAYKMEEGGSATPNAKLQVLEKGKIIKQFRLFDDALMLNTAKSLQADNLSVVSFGIPVEEFHFKTPQDTIPESALYAMKNQQNQYISYFNALGEGLEKEVHGFYDGSIFISEDKHLYNILDNEISEQLKACYHITQYTSMQLMPLHAEATITNGEIEFLDWHKLGDTKKGHCEH